MDSWMKILVLRGEILPGGGGLNIKYMSKDKNAQGKRNVMKIEDQGKKSGRKEV